MAFRRGKAKAEGRIIGIRFKVSDPKPADLAMLKTLAARCRELRYHLFDWAVANDGSGPEHLRAMYYEAARLAPDLSADMRGTIAGEIRTAIKQYRKVQRQDPLARPFEFKRVIIPVKVSSIYELAPEGANGYWRLRVGLWARGGTEETTASLRLAADTNRNGDGYQLAHYNAAVAWGLEAGSSPIGDGKIVLQRGKWLYIQALSLAPVMAVEGLRVAGVDVGRHHLAVVAMPENGKTEFVGRYNWVRDLIADRWRKTRLYRAGLRKRANAESDRAADKTKTICQQVAARVADVLVQWEATHVAMEDLTGMRERLAEKFGEGTEGAVVNARFPYYRLQAAIEYACGKVGIATVKVEAKYSSQTCWRCGERGKRDGLEFRCDECGKEHADANAARVIAQRGREEVMAQMDQARPAVPAAGPRAPVRPHADEAQERRESCAGLGNWPEKNEATV